MDQLGQCMLAKMCPSPVNGHPGLNNNPPFFFSFSSPSWTSTPSLSGKAVLKHKVLFVMSQRAHGPLKFGDSTKVLVPPSKVCDLPKKRKKANCMKLKWSSFFVGDCKQRAKYTGFGNPWNSLFIIYMEAAVLFLEF